MYFFRKKLQLLFKILASRLFKFFYGEIICNNSVSQKIKIDEVKKNNQIYKLASIEEGRISITLLRNL